jgi:hypothetical protein
MPQPRNRIPFTLEKLNQVAARIVLRLPAYRPGRFVDHVDCPVLYISCSHDEVTPANLIAADVSRTRRGQLIRCSGTHFQIYREPLRDRLITDQVEFLTTHHLTTS